MDRLKTLLSAMMAEQPQYTAPKIKGVTPFESTGDQLALDAAKSRNVLTQSLANYTDRKTNAVEFSGSGGGLDYIAKIESGGKYSAVNPKTGAMGKYQFMPATLKGYGVDSKRFMASPELQESIASKHLNYVESGLTKAGIPLTDKNVYGAWQQGVKGFTDIYNGNNSAVSLRNIQSNGAGSIEMWKRKWL